MRIGNTCKSGLVGYLNYTATDSTLTACVRCAVLDDFLPSASWHCFPPKCWAGTQCIFGSAALIVARPAIHRWGPPLVSIMITYTRHVVMNVMGSL
jgi:hypothetical protein